MGAKPGVLTALVMCAAMLAWADDATVIEQGGEWLIGAASYEATVGADGALTSMRVRQADGEPVEFLVSKTSAPRGLYTYLDGWLPLENVQQPEPNVLTASAEQAHLRYEFADDAITVTLENLADKSMSLLGIFLPEVNVISDEFGFYYRLPMKGAWHQIVWYRDGAKLSIEGRASVWGPWAAEYAVWQLRLAAGETATVTLRPGAQDELEAEQVSKALTEEHEPPTDPEGPMWDLELLSRTPQVWPAEAHHEEGVDAIFYEGRPFRGRPTRVFAYMGMPEVETGEKVPAMVLIHGGGGTAEAEWVRIWNRRGYAAISMDTCGCVPGGEPGARPRHEFSGSPGTGGWGQTDWPREDQWTYHGVADALLANSLLRSLPEVDADRIGVTGISWGGYLTSIVAGVDPRLKLAVPVYGCGHYLDTLFATQVRNQGEEGADRWMRWWDPSAYLKDAAMPMLWVTGTNDFAYWLPGLQKSYRDPTGPRALSVTLRMGHGHVPGWTPEAIYAFADSVLKDGAPLPRITAQGRDGDEVWIGFEGETAIERAELLYTRDTDDEWPEREWFAEPARLENGRATATLPEGATVWFINTVDERGLTVSSEHEEDDMMKAELVGIPIKAIVYGNSHAVLAPSPEGREDMFYIPYYSTTGGELVGYHAASGELARFKLHSSGGYGLCVGSDGALYVGGINPGKLQRVDAAAGTVEDLGGPEFGVSYIWAAATSHDGKRVYGACYPTCNVIEYDIETGELRDLGRAVEGEQYVRSVCVDHRGRPWAGVGSHAHLVIYDLETGERRDVLPEKYRASSCCYDLMTSGKYVVASVEMDSYLLVFDAETEEVVREVLPPEGQFWWMNCEGAPEGEAYIRTCPDGDLYHYDIEADKLTLAAAGLGQCERVVDGRYVHGISDQDYFLYDLQEKRDVARSAMAEAADGMRIQTLTGHSDGRLYGSTYINQHMFNFDPASDELTDMGKVIRVGGQVDSIHSGRDGKVYMGSYVRAHLSIYDPDLPWQPSTEAGGNPLELGEVGHGQYRTCATALGLDDRIWVGSIPSYNSGPTGALSAWDPATGEHESWLDLAPGGNIRHVVTGERYLYCSGSGVLFAWDPVAEEKAGEVALSVSALAMTSAGLLAATGEELVLLDAETLAETARLPSGIGQITHMAVAPDGSIYGVSKTATCRIDPEAATATQVAETGGHLVAVDSAGTVYLARGAELWKLK